MSKKGDFCKASRKSFEWWSQAKGTNPDVLRKEVDWRIGWARSVRAKLCDDLIDFLKRIDGGETWRAGKKKGKQQASIKREGETLDVQDFRHAAWLLGWLCGYEKESDDQANGTGTTTGIMAANNYRKLLYCKGWKDNPEFKARLGIDDGEESTGTEAP